MSERTVSVWSALGKALGTGIRAPVLLTAIAVSHDTLGKPALGRSYSETILRDDGFLREGTYDDSGRGFTQAGLAVGDTSIVLEFAIIPPDGELPSSEDYATLQQVKCSLSWQGLDLGCS